MSDSINVEEQQPVNDVVVDTNANAEATAVLPQEPTVLPPIVPVVPVESVVVQSPLAPPPPVVEVPSVVVNTPVVEISVLGKIAYQNLVDYSVNMAARKSLTVEDGVRQQVQLFRTLNNIINNLEADFNTVYASVLQLFNEHKDGAFHECRVFRFFDVMPLTKEERASFQRLLNLLKLTADPKGRKLALKQVSLSTTLEFIAEKGKQKVVAFYSK